MEFTARGLVLLEALGADPSVEKQNASLSLSLAFKDLLSVQPVSWVLTEEWDTMLVNFPHIDTAVSQ